MTEHDRTIADPAPEDAVGIERAIRGCGLFTAEEADGFAAMLPSLLADADQHWRVLRAGAETVGAAYFSLERMSADVWNLRFVGLDAPAQGGGGGTRLLVAVEDACRAAGGRLLLVETSSAAGLAATRAFYRARGYEEEARIRDYRAPGDDKVVFRRALAA